MHILLISQRETDHSLIAGLLDRVVGADHGLTVCRADPGALARVPVSGHQLILWGEVTDATLTMRLLGELNRHDEVPPIIVISDGMARGGNDSGSCGGPPDILPRSGLTTELLRDAIGAMELPLAS